LIKEKKQKNLEILVVEDNPADVRLMQEALKESQLRSTIHVARNGVEALDFFRRQIQEHFKRYPDLIILDLNLPLSHGFDVLTHLKSDPRLRRIPVIVLSSSANREDILKSYDLHANCYILKPVDLEPFVELIQSIENFWSQTVNLPYE
jgi:CheY-like chemotaxis protein